MAYDPSLDPRSALYPSNLNIPGMLSDLPHSATASYNSMPAFIPPVSAVSPMFLTKTDSSETLIDNPEDQDPRISLHGMITVFSYYPKEGEASTPLTMELLKSPALPDTSSLRLVFGAREVATVHVRGTRPARLIASVPDVQDVGPEFSSGVPLRLDVVDRVTHDIIDSVVFGWFTYWGLSVRPKSESPICAPSSLRSYLEDDAVNGSSRSLCKRSRTSRRMTLPSSRPTKPPTQTLRYIPYPTTEKPFTRSRRSTRLPTPSSPSHSSIDGEYLPDSSTEIKQDPEAVVASWDSQVQPIQPTQVRRNLKPQKCQPILEDDLEDMTKGWSSEEAASGRRVIRFFVRRDEHRLCISFEPLQPRDYRDGMICVSCIYYRKTDQCYITSTELLDLLQGLLSVHFSVEHKNRYRRNLEELKPIPIRKADMTTSDFYNRLMGYDEPRPRRINKDLKLFCWSHLPKALTKIISKYSISELGPLHPPLPPPAVPVEVQDLKPFVEDSVPLPMYEQAPETVQSENTSPQFTDEALNIAQDDQQYPLSPQPIKHMSSFEWHIPQYDNTSASASGSGSQFPLQESVATMPCTQGDIYDLLQQQGMLNTFEPPPEYQTVRDVLNQVQQTVKSDDAILAAIQPTIAIQNQDQYTQDERRVLSELLVPNVFLDAESDFRALYANIMPLSDKANHLE